MSKKCSHCGETNPDKFYGHKRHVCAACHNRYTIAKGQEKKRMAVEYLGGKCSTCGYEKCLEALDFHHTDFKTKDTQFSQKRGWAWERLRKELDKCVLLCRNCHAEHHAKHGYYNEV